MQNKHFRTPPKVTFVGSQLPRRVIVFLSSPFKAKWLNAFCPVPLSTALQV
jgi:hypothetical protein